MSEFLDKSGLQLYAQKTNNIIRDVYSNYPYGEPTQGLVYTLNADKTSYSVTDYSGTSSSVIIANQKNGLPVTSIGQNAFRDKSITSVVIPDNIEEIGGNAFKACLELKEVIISPSSKLRTLHDSCFEASGVEKLAFPEGLTNVGSSVFSYCEALKELHLPKTVTYLHSGILQDCVNLVNVTLPFVGDSIKTSTDTYQYPLGYVFGESYTDDTTMKVTQSFYAEDLSTQVVQSFYFPPNLQNVTILGGNLLSGSFSGLTGKLKSVTLGEDIQLIHTYAFNGLASAEATYTTSTSNVDVYFNCLQAWCIPSTNALTGALMAPTAAYPSSGNIYIGSNVKELNNTWIPVDRAVLDSAVLETIGPYAFTYSLSSTSKVTLPEGITTLKTNAIQGNSYLTVILPASCTSAESQSIIGATAVVTYNYNFLPSGFASDFAPSYTIGVASSETVTYVFDSKFAQIRTAEYSAYVGENAGDSYSPPIDALYPSAAYDASSLSTMWTIDTSGFITACSIVAEKVAVPEQLYGIYIKGLSTNLFSGNTTLKEIYLPKSLTTIQQSAFQGCVNLESVHISGNSLSYIQDNAFQGCSKLININLPSSVKRIGSKAFADCIALPCLTVPFGCYIASSDFCEGMKGQIRLHEYSYVSAGTFPDNMAKNNVVIYSPFPTSNSAYRIGDPNSTSSLSYLYFNRACYFCAPSTIDSHEGKSGFQFKIRGTVDVFIDGKFVGHVDSSTGRYFTVYTGSGAFTSYNYSTPNCIEFIGNIKDIERCSASNLNSTWAIGDVYTIACVPYNYSSNKVWDGMFKWVKVGNLDLNNIPYETDTYESISYSTEDTITLHRSTVSFNEIGKEAFYGATITSVTIPKTVTKISADAFRQTTGSYTLRFEQPAGTAIQMPTSNLFYHKNAKSLTIYTDNETIKNYNWAGDNVTPTFYHLDGTAWT